MKCSRTLMIGALSAMSVAVYADNAANALRIDGVVRVKKASLSTARVIVVPGEGETRVITKDLGHFTLTLDLQNTYLLSFECAGCVTKQLLFDTRVPTTGAGYDFPFQVTLEPAPADAPFEYAGPVGLIRFDGTITDFGYDTNYKIARNDALAERLERARTDLDGGALPVAVPVPASTSTRVVKGTVSSEAPAVTAAPAPAPPTTGPDMPKGHFEELAPTHGEVAPLVHPTGTTPSPAVVPPAPVVARAAVPKPVPPAAPIAVAPVVEQSMRPPAPVVADGRSEEVIAEKLRVTTIVHIRTAGQEAEYRRVAQYYGGVQHFKNGQACSEQTYLQGIAQ